MKKKIVGLLAIISLVVLFLIGCQPSTAAPQPSPAPAPAPPAVTEPPSSSPAAPPSVTQPAPPPIPEGVTVGYRAPDFELQTLDGQTVKLSALRGKPVLVNFWATWCPPCKAEMPYLQQINDEWKDKGLILLAIDLIGTKSGTVTETPDVVRKFMADYNLSMIVPLDDGLKTAKAYAVTAIPSTFLIDIDGVIRYKKIGAFANKAEIEAALPLIMP